MWRRAADLRPHWGRSPSSIRSHAASRNVVGYLKAMSTSGGSRPESHMGGPDSGVQVKWISYRGPVTTMDGKSS